MQAIQECKVSTNSRPAAQARACGQRRIGPVAAIALGLLTAAAGCRGGKKPDPPGESADAAAAGSNYGVGRTKNEIRKPAEKSGTGPSATGNPDEHAVRRDGAANPAAGFGGAVGRAVEGEAVKGK